MAVPGTTPPLPRILAEAVAAAFCLLSLPLSLDRMSKAVHAGGHASGWMLWPLLASLLAVLLLVDLYRMMRRRETVPSPRPEENTGSTRP